MTSLPMSPGAILEALEEKKAEGIGFTGYGGWLK